MEHEVSERNVMLSLAYADVTWLVEILEKIEEVVDNDPFISKEATESIKWLIKQGLKVKREQ